MLPNQPPGTRGRARGRARNTPPQAGLNPALTVNVEQEPPTTQESSPPSGISASQGQPVVTQETFADIFEHRGGNGNGNSENGTSSGGNGNGNGGSSGSGGGSSSGKDSNGSDDGYSGRGSHGSGDHRGSPRGSPRSPGNGNGTGDDPMPDYVKSRPVDPQFSKKGVSGTPINVLSNYYQFRKHPEFQMVMYVVKVSPTVDEVWKVKKLVRQGLAETTAYLLTGNMLFTTRPVQQELLTFVKAVDDKTPEEIFTVTLEFKEVVKDSNMVVFQFYNLIVRRIQEIMEYKLLGRHYFDPTQVQRFPQWRLELWPGFNNSVRQQESALMLNVESCWKVLETENMFMKMTTIRQNCRPDEFEAGCTSAIVGMMVITKYNNRAYKISRIDFGAKPSDTFETKKGAVTYVDYYMSKYRTQINAVKQPMLVSVPSIREQRRGITNDIYLVPELCFPCGLNDQLRSNFNLMKDINRCLQLPAAGKVQTMRRFIDGVIRNEEIQKTIQRWNVRILPDPVNCPARLLPNEKILCGNNQSIPTDDKGDWEKLFRNQKMLTSMRLNKWGIVVTNRDGDGVDSLIGTMQRVGGPFGYQIAKPNIIRINSPNSRSYIEGINELMSKAGGAIDMIFIILANNNADTYAAVKKRCAVDFGVSSQCFLAKNVRNKGLMSICTKMLIQMNAKQGGEPWAVGIPLKQTLVLGYDVHHGGKSGGMSVGAMTATLNDTYGRFFSAVNKLTQQEEVATAVQKLFTRCLKAYEDQNGFLPSNIVMYRDGVGEGQLRAVYEQELKGFKDHLKERYQDSKTQPKLCFIVVNKRINTRFFEPSRQTYESPKPGTIVDCTVTRPERYDFFLISQNARQGCVSPTYYNVLCNELALDPDKIQRLTYKFCHLYYNWTGTVSVPGPCQNAHKLALLVGTALKRPAHDNLSKLLYFL